MGGCRSVQRLEGVVPAGNLLIRCAGPADASDVQALYRQLVDNPAISVSPERIRQVAEDPRTALLVGEIDGTVGATALVSLCQDVMFDARPFAVVENLVVDARWRGQGVGASLFRHIEGFCVDRDCSKIMLLSSIGRVDAHRFFERMGFRGGAKRGFVKYRREFSG